MSLVVTRKNFRGESYTKIDGALKSQALASRPRLATVFVSAVALADVPAATGEQALVGAEVGGLAA